MAADRIRIAAKRNPEGRLTPRVPLARRVGIPNPFEPAGSNTQPVGGNDHSALPINGNYMRKCASGGQSLANAERGAEMCGFVGKIDTKFFITNVQLYI